MSNFEKAEGEYYKHFDPYDDDESVGEFRCEICNALLNEDDIECPCCGHEIKD